MIHCIRPNRNSFRRVMLLAGLLCFAWHCSSRACSVPVFRWALEKWSPGVYDLVVLYRGALSAEDQALVDLLTSPAAGGDAPSNIRVVPVNLDAEPDTEYAALWKEQPNAALPWALLRSPTSLQPARTIWAGALAELSSVNFLDSPARRELARRILDGESGVWLLLECGDAEKDDAAARLLEETLGRLEKTLRLPDMTGDPVLTGANAPDVSGLRVAFSLIRISRRDDAEKWLVRMLEQSEPDLPGSREPIAFPVFGRGRVLYAFIGAGIDAENIANACAFLVGRCSCEIKEGNPGMDLLIAAQWGEDTSLTDSFREISLPPLPGAGSIAAEPPPAKPAPERAAPKASEQSSSGGAIPRNALIAVGAIAAGIAAAAFALRRRAAG